MNKTLLLCAIAWGLLAGCADVRQAEYQRPDAPLKTNWTPREGAVSARATISPQWWQEFRDPFLDSLVTRAIAGN